MPAGLTPAEVLGCLAAACAAGDVASLLVPSSQAGGVTAEAQRLGVAVIVTGEARDSARSGADGLQLDAASEDLPAARQALGKDRILGAYAGGSRHLAMEAAEAGADYIAFDQAAPTLGGETIVGWWQALTEIPCVAFTPASADQLDTLLPQKPDFIRPPDAMWQGPEEARLIVTALAHRLGAS